MRFLKSLNVPAQKVSKNFVHVGLHIPHWPGMFAVHGRLEVSPSLPALDCNASGGKEEVHSILVLVCRLQDERLQNICCFVPVIFHSIGVVHDEYLLQIISGYSYGNGIRLTISRLS